MLFECQNHSLFKKLVAHQKLFARSADVSITMFNSHAGKSSLLDLKSNAGSQIHGYLGFLGWMNSDIHGSGENVEALVSDFIDHIF